jgi:hypothetical protein
MGLRLACMAATAVAMVAAAAADARQPPQGNYRTAGRRALSFNVFRPTHQRPEVYAMSTRAPVRCPNGERLQHHLVTDFSNYSLEGPKVRAGRFAYRASSDDRKSDHANRLRLAGRFSRMRTSARGVLRITYFQGSLKGCTTGRVRWRATLSRRMKARDVFRDKYLT